MSSTLLSTEDKALMHACQCDPAQGMVAAQGNQKPGVGTVAVVLLSWAAASGELRDWGGGDGGHIKPQSKHCLCSLSAKCTQLW